MVKGTGSGEKIIVIFNNGIAAFDVAPMGFVAGVIGIIRGCPIHAIRIVVGTQQRGQLFGIICKAECFAHIAGSGTLINTVKIIIG